MAFTCLTTDCNKNKSGYYPNQRASLYKMGEVGGSFKKHTLLLRGPGVAPAMPAFWVLSTVLIQFPSNTSRKAEDGPNVWGSATHVGDLGRMCSSWHWPGPALAIGITWGVKQQRESFSLSLPLCFCNFAFKPHKYIFITIMLKNQYLFQIDLEPTAAYSWKYMKSKKY